MKKLFILCGIVVFVLTGCGNSESITLDSLTNDDGIVFTVSSGRKDCIPVELVVYDNGEYALLTTYKASDDVNQDSILEYSKSVSGTYEYDVTKIVENSIDANDKTYDMNDLPIYEIYTGKGRYYTVEDNNKYLDEFLELIDIDLNVCAEAEDN